MLITSTSNEKIKYLKKLKINKNIIAEKKFLVEGYHLVNEAYKCGLLLEVITTGKSYFNVDVIEVTDNVYKSLSSLKSSPDIIGVCKLKEESNVLGEKIIILDNVQDPGNLGTIIRSANAFNFNTVVLGNGCVSKYNEKVIRSTQGMFFKTNIINKELQPFIKELNNKGYFICSTNVSNGVDLNEIKAKKIAVIIGNEGSGVSKDLSALCHKNIYINMNKTCESLNAAVAASIIMYEFNKKG